MQACIQCIEELTRSLSDQLEIMIQQVCENVIKDMSVRAGYYFHDGDYSKEVCKIKVDIKKSIQKQM